MHASGTSEVGAKSRAELEELGNALYQDAHNRRLRRQIVQAMHSAIYSAIESALHSAIYSDSSEWQNVHAAALPSDSAINSAI